MSRNSLVVRNNGLLPRREDVFFPIESYFNSFFDDFFNRGSESVAARAGYPKMDVTTTEAEWVVEVAVPGVDRQNLAVEVKPHGTGKVLRIAGRMEEGRMGMSQVKELRRSQFERVLTLPEGLADEDPEATLKNGILTLVWKWRREPDRPGRKIDVRE